MRGCAASQNFSTKTTLTSEGSENFRAARASLYYRPGASSVAFDFRCYFVSGSFASIGSCSASLHYLFEIIARCWLGCHSKKFQQGVS